MTKKRKHSPHSPHSLAQQPRATGSTHSPRPLVIKGRAGVCVRVTEASTRTNERPGDWIPPYAQLPDSVEEIEAGKQRQAELFPECRDNTQAGRVARLLGTVPGIRTAATARKAQGPG